MIAPRGIRNNNPSNLDFDLKEPPWLGEIRPSQDPRFCQFDTMAHGVRALGKELIAYHDEHHCNTVREVINRWAPPVENDTSAYVTDVARGVGLGPDDPIDFRSHDSLCSLAAAIIEHENGSPDGGSWVSDADLSAGITEAMA